MKPVSELKRWTGSVRRNLANRVPFSVSMWIDDMGSQSYPSVADLDDLLWHVNKSRNHDGLRDLDADDIEAAVFYPTNSARITLTFH